MTKNFLSWISAGLAAIFAAALQYFTSGHELTLKAAGVFVGTALLVRAAQWVIATFGPAIPAA